MRQNDVDAVSCPGGGSRHIPPGALRRHVAVRCAFCYHRSSAERPEQVDGINVLQQAVLHVAGLKPSSTLCWLCWLYKVCYMAMYNA